MRFRTLVIGKTEQEATSQNNIVYKAITYARMVAANLVDPSPTVHGGAARTDGLDHDAPRPKEGVTFEQLIEFDHDKPRPFQPSRSSTTTFSICRQRVCREAQLQSVTASDFATKFKSILDKLSVLRRDPRIRFMMREWT